MQSLPRKKRALEAEAEVPKTFVFICDGFRVVLPQWYVYNIFVKGRWLNPCADGSPQTYGSLLASEFSNFPASYFAAAMAAGRVHVNSALTQPNCVVRSGDLLTHRVHHHEPPSTAQLPDILFTSPRILVVSKPAGLATHAAGNILHNSLLRVLSDMELARPELFSADRPDPHLPFTPPPLADRGVYTTAALPAGTADVAPATRPLLPAHRLDRATSGVLVLTRDSVAAAALTSLFADKSDKSAGPTANANANANASAVSAAAAASANAGADESFDLSDPFYADAAATALAPADTAASSAASTAAAPVVASGRYVRKSYLARVVGRFPASAAAAGLLSCGHPALTPADAAAAAAASAAAADAAPAADGRGAWLLVRVPVQCVGIKKSFHAVPLPQRAHFPPSAAAGSAPAATDGAPAGPCALCAGFAAAGDGVWPSARDPDSACAPGPAAGATAAFPSTGVVAAEAARDAAWEPTAADWQPAREAVSAFRLVRYDPAPRAADAQVGADTDVVDAAAGSSLVECVPLTGRTHQLRVHLWWMGHPIGNDAAYGGLACAGDKVPSLAHAPWPDADMDADADENAAGAAAAAVAGADTSVPPSVEAQVSAAFARLPRRAAAFLPSDNAADVAAAPDAATTAAGAAAPADGSDFWSPLRCSRADVRAWTQDALAETRRAAEAVATDEDGFDAGRQRQTPAALTAHGPATDANTADNSDAGAVGAPAETAGAVEEDEKEPWCPMCVKFVRTRRGHAPHAHGHAGAAGEAVAGADAGASAAAAAAAAAASVSAAGHTYRIWLHAWRLRARTAVAPATAIGKQAKKVRPEDMETVEFDVTAPAPEWAQPGFDAHAWRQAKLMKEPRAYPFVWA